MKERLLELIKAYREDRKRIEEALEECNFTNSPALLEYFDKIFLQHWINFFDRKDYDAQASEVAYLVGALIRAGFTRKESIILADKLITNSTGDISHMELVSVDDEEDEEERKGIEPTEKRKFLS